MSTHLTAKAVNLHHQQVNGGKARRVAKQAARREKYLAVKREFKMRERLVWGFAFLVFCYSMILTAVYMRWWVFG